MIFDTRIFLSHLFLLIVFGGNISTEIIDLYTQLKLKPEISHLMYIIYNITLHT